MNASFLVTLVLTAALAVGLFALGYRLGGKNSADSEGVIAELRTQLETVRKEQSTKQADSITTNAEFKALKEKLAELTKLAGDSDRRRIESETAIKGQITSMSQHNDQLLNQTRAIAGALSSSQTRGKFGEAHLEQLLEGAGLVEGEHFTRQRHAERNEDSGAIPDITIHVPGGSVIYIDSKFPFERFYEAFETEDENEREQLLAAHSKDLMKHIDALSKRKYSERGASPDFVVLYAPVESIFTEALKADPALLNKAFALNITIATPTSMMALLRTVGYLFSRNRVATNAAEIQELAAKFLKDVGSLHTKIEAVGDRLSSTLKAYNELIPTAETTVLSAAKKMRALEVPGKALGSIKEVPSSVRQLKSKQTKEIDEYILGADLDDEPVLELEDNEQHE